MADKSNEITAIPNLLNILDLQGRIVTIDAMGAQAEIAEQIIDQGADYVLSLKGNQGSLHEYVEQLFDWAHKTDFKAIEHKVYQTVDKGHGCIRAQTLLATGQGRASRRCAALERAQSRRDD